MEIKQANSECKYLVTLQHWNTKSEIQVKMKYVPFEDCGWRHEDGSELDHQWNVIAIHHVNVFHRVIHFCNSPNSGWFIFGLWCGGVIGLVIMATVSGHLFAK